MLVRRSLLVPLLFAAALATPATAGAATQSILKDSKVTASFVVGERALPVGCTWAVFARFDRPKVKAPKAPRGYKLTGVDRRRLSVRGDYVVQASGGTIEQSVSGSLPFQDVRYAQFFPRLDASQHAVVVRSGSASVPGGCATDVAAATASYGHLRPRLTVTQTFTYKKVKKRKVRRKR